MGGGEREGRKIERATDRIHVLDEFVLGEPDATHIAIILVVITTLRESTRILLVLDDTVGEFDETPNGVPDLNSLQHLFGRLTLKHLQRAASLLRL